jgi:hypothetical protein
MWTRTLFEKQMVPRLVNKFPEFYGVLAHWSSPLIPGLSQMNLVLFL